MGNLTVVKIGGNVLDNEQQLKNFLEKFSTLSGTKILVHGGGILASQMLEKTGIPINMYEGRRITDFDTLRVCTMVYAGYINKNIVAQLQKLNCNAIGLSGADGNCIKAVRRAAIPIDYGYVGDISADDVDLSLLSCLLEKNITLVFSAITHDGEGCLLNTNADTVASTLAVVLSKKYRTKLIFCFEKQGVLSDPNDDTTVIDNLIYDRFIQLKQSKSIGKGMLPKLDNAFKALRNGVHEIYIKHANDLLLDKGTKITQNE